MYFAVFYNTNTKFLYCVAALSIQLLLAIFLNRLMELSLDNSAQHLVAQQM